MTIPEASARRRKVVAKTKKTDPFFEIIDLLVEAVPRVIAKFEGSDHEDSGTLDVIR